VSTESFSYQLSARMVVCDICKKEFKRKDNMLRHKKTVHGDYISDKDETNETISDDDSSTEESDMETDLDDTDETLDPWLDIIDFSYKALQPEFDAAVSELLHDGGISEKEARKRVFKELLPKYRKHLLDKYLSRILWCDSLRKDTVHKAIRRVARRLREEDDYDSEESWKYATNKRKYLFDKLFKQYEPPEFHGTQ